LLKITYANYALNIRYVLYHVCPVFASGWPRTFGRHCNTVALRHFDIWTFNDCTKVRRNFI